MQGTIPSTFFNRIRQDPIASSVQGSLPVLFFGDLFNATIATIGINPSRQEYLAPGGQELDGVRRRFETLRSLDAKSRATLDDAQITKSVERMRAYFDPSRPVYSWFNSLSRVVDGMGFSFANRTAAHLDLVQEATDPVWSGLHSTDRDQANGVLRRDVPFLRDQIHEFPLRVIVCTSARVAREVSAVVPANTVASGRLKRLAWTVAVAETPRGIVGVVGWNIPLARPTGLDRAGHTQLGKLLRAELGLAGVLPKTV